MSERIFLHGDLDSDGARGSDRLITLDAEEASTLRSLESGGKLSLRRMYAKYQSAVRPYLRTRTKRIEKNRLREPVLKSAAAWRSEGIQQLYPFAHLSPALSALVFVFLMLLDFYVFAEALGLLVDNGPFEPGWYFGGLLGLLVFWSGYILARMLKDYSVGRVQQKQIKIWNENLDSSPLGSAEGAKYLRPLRVEASFFWVIGSVFLALAFAGFFIRISADSNSEELPVTVMSSLVPFVIVAFEYWMYDPLDTKASEPGLWENFYRRRAGKRKAKLENALVSYASHIDRIESAYAQERSIARVIGADLGIDMAAPESGSPVNRVDVSIDQDLLFRPLHPKFAADGLDDPLMDDSDRADGK